MKINFHACCGTPVSEEHEIGCPESPGYRESNTFREDPRKVVFGAAFGVPTAVQPPHRLSNPDRQPQTLKVVAGNLRNAVSVARKHWQIPRLSSPVVDDLKLGNLYRLELKTGDVNYALLREMPRGSVTQIVENFDAATQ